MGYPLHGEGGGGGDVWFGRGGSFGGARQHQKLCVRV